MLKLSGKQLILLPYKKNLTEYSVRFFLKIPAKHFEKNGIYYRAKIYGGPCLFISGLLLAKYISLPSFVGFIQTICPIRIYLLRSFWWRISRKYQQYDEKS